MAHKTNSFERFWKELKRRKVVHVITVYAATAFVILELVNMVARPLQLPDWTEALVIVLLCIGFVISVFVSWVYDITPAGVKKTKPVSELKHVDHTTHEVSSGWKIATYVSGVIIVALVVFNYINKRNLNADISKLEKSIAVLPFINDSSDTTNVYFINGIMERITNNLQMIKELRVIGRTSVEQYRNNKTKSNTEIAKELGVNFIVEGSGQRYGNSFSLVVQLIKAKSKETHLWARTFDQEIKEVNDYIRIQSQIAQAVATELQSAITPEEKQLIEKTPTINLAALTFYQRGRDEFEKYWINKNNLEALSRAEYYYQRALEHDTDYAQAYVGLAMIYKNKNIRREYFSENYLDSVLILADIALLHDKNAAEAYVLRGDYYSEKGDLKRALVEYNQAIKINPNSWEAYWGRANLSMDDDYINGIYDCKKALSLIHGTERQLILRSLSMAYSQLGFSDLASKYYLEILELYDDSLSYLVDLGGLEYSRGNYSKSIEYLEKAYKTDSNRIILNLNVNVFSALGELNALISHFEESLKYYKRHMNILKTNEEINYSNMHRIGYAYWKNGYTKEAGYYFNLQMEYCNNLIKSDRPNAQNYLTYYDRAGIYAFRGDKEKAYEDLRKFNQKTNIMLWMFNLIKTDPLFDSIRDEPEFQQIVRDVEAKYQTQHERVKKWLEEQGML